MLYDKEGDYHFDTISAYIKSLRGSDPDAALYWLAKMVYAGEDPRFMFRRMLIFAGEDVGLADPNALRVVVAAAEAFDRVGLPEGRFHLTTATLYLATAPKSNSSLGFFDALGVVEQERDAEVPTHLRDGNRDKEGFGHGEGYLYPHAYRDHWVAQQYLPEAMQGKVFYKPGDQGYEQEITAASRAPPGSATGRYDRGRGSRPAGGADLYRRPGGTRPRSMAGAHRQRRRPAVGRPARSGAGRRRVQRHHLLLDLNAGSGLADLGSAAARAGGRRCDVGSQRAGRRRTAPAGRATA